jgi:hypothetical protein
MESRAVTRPDPFSLCFCGQPADAGAFCSGCTGKLPVKLQQRLDRAVRRGDQVEYAKALTKARAILK